MKKIIIFSPSRVWGGVEKNVLLRARFLSERGYRVKVVLLKDHFKERFESLEKVETVEVPARGGDFNFFVVWRYIRILKDFQPDLVFVASKQDWWLVSLSCKLAGITNIVLYLGIYRKLNNRLKFRIIFNRFNARAVVNSDSLKNELLQKSAFFDEQNLIRIYNGFSLPDVTEQECSQEKLALLNKLNLSPDTLLVGVAGRFTRQKGFDLLPEIIEPLPENVHVIHAGSGQQEEEIKAYLNRSSIKNRLHFLGYQSDMKPFYSAIDVFLLCSRNEGMANVLNEALGYGKPVVSTKVPGSKELLNSGEFGLLTDIEDTPALSESLQQILNTEVTFPFDKQRAHIKNSFSMEKMIENTEKLFH